MALIKVYTPTGKTILGKFYPKNVCVDVQDEEARFLIDKEGFKIFKEARHKKKYSNEGGKK
ncbi:MAG: hypothetical protein KAJ93_01070 [Methanosarcinales archaeon]|nr:hypothetical protein [Methanosarcinales archaeon]